MARLLQPAAGRFVRTVRRWCSVMLCSFHRCGHTVDRRQWAADAWSTEGLAGVAPPDQRQRPLAVRARPGVTQDADLARLVDRAEWPAHGESGGAVAQCALDGARLVRFITRPAAGYRTGQFSIAGAAVVGCFRDAVDGLSLSAFGAPLLLVVARLAHKAGGDGVGQEERGACAECAARVRDQRLAGESQHVCEVEITGGDMRPGLSERVVVGGDERVQLVQRDRVGDSRAQISAQQLRWMLRDCSGERVDDPTHRGRVIRRVGYRRHDQGVSGRRMVVRRTGGGVAGLSPAALRP
ncbi:hypothetical protein SAMN05661093_10917 [Kibdelosporangium aridum]|uniref:Uncharacterized protein n=1 Tax=Kibdelosporangium aridum TaxID=2030 RepID=A0A1W2FZW4_KIBAR|nr:hypothetical protein SAMN05661093_10917 [Kibdelosporangium aridum]